MAKTLYYLDDWADEVLPCAPTLEGWAVWLAADIRGDWGRDGPVLSGSEFSCGRLTDLGTIEVTKTAGEAWASEDLIPEGTDTFFLRWSRHHDGWDAEHSGDSIADALQECAADDGQAHLACARTDPTVMVRFEIVAGGPSLIVIAAVQ